MTKNLSLLLLICACMFKANGQAGSPDKTFGKMGIQTTAFLNNSNSLYQEARVVLTSANGDIFVVARFTLNPWYTRIVKYLPDGRLDSTYGNMGYSNTANVNVTSAVMQGDKIILAGSIYTGNGDDFGVARYTKDGFLDASFGVNGIVKTDFNNSSDDYANAIALQGDKIIVGGYTYDFFNGNTDFALARYTANGKLDSTFAENGKIRTDFNNTSDDRANAIALQGNKIILAGYTYIFAGEDYYDYAVARYTADGRLDSSFGENGKVATDFNNSDDRANAMVLQGNKILLAGYTENSIGFYFDFALVRYTTDGVLDSTFGQNGKAITDLNNSYDDAYAITLQGNKILVAGSSNGDIGIARYTADGNLDISFGENGKVIADFNNNTTQEDAYSIALQGDKFLIGGSISYNLINGFPSDFAVIRYSVDGKLDASFGTDGKFIGHFPISRTAFTTTAIQKNKIIAAGYALNGTSNDFILARYSLNGALDLSFGKGGLVATDFNNSDDKANSLALQGDKIIVGGYTGDDFNGFGFVLVRYTAAGVLDSSFGKNGIVTTEFINSFDRANSIALQGNKILVSGSVFNQDNFTSDFALVRYTADGRPDSTFGQNGIVTTDFNNAYDRANSLTLQADKIIVCGSSRSIFGAEDFALARYSSNGKLDPSFGQNGIVTTDFNNADDRANSIDLQGGKLIVGGYSGDPFTGFGFVLTRYTADGILDASFGQNGKVTTDFSSSFGANSIAVQGDEIIVGGQVGYSDFSFNRYNADGSLDSSFGKNGKVTTSFTGTASLGKIALDQNRLYAVGSLSFGPDESYGAVAAYQLQCPVMLSCAADRTLPATEGVCTAVVKGIDPVLSPVSNFALVNYTLSGATVDGGKGSACGKTFNLGTTLVTYSLAADPQKTCSFNVTIVPAKEQCNGKDDNCDGQVDEGCPCRPFITFKHVVIYQSGGEAKITVTLSKKTNEPVYVFYYTQGSESRSEKRGQKHLFDGTSDKQQDYIPDAGILTIPAGDQIAVIKVPVINDNVAEMDEYFHVQLLYAVNADIATHDDIITIKDGVLLAPGLMNNKVHKSVVPLSIAAYPVPSKTGFTIQIQGSDYKQRISVNVYDVNGRSIEQKKNIALGQSIWLGDHYMAGTYIIEAIQGKEKVSTKVTKVNK